MLIDTHAHIHFDQFKDNLDEVFENAKKANIESIITVGTNLEDSIKALDFVVNNNNIPIAKGIKLFASIGIHPHDAQSDARNLAKLEGLIEDNKYKNALVAIGECGLDYYKSESSKSYQKEALISQIELAQKFNLPIIFHVRNAWDDFFDVIEKYPNLRGVIHSFTGNKDTVTTALQYNLCFGLNGIMTFTKDQNQLEAVKAIPSQKLLLETDCPFLAPVPFRGKQNEPSYIIETAKFMANLRNVSFDDLVSQSSFNAKELFGI